MAALAATLTLIRCASGYLPVTLGLIRSVLARELRRVHVVGTEVHEERHPLGRC